MLGKYLDIAAEKLKSGTKVYLCPASMETILLARMLKYQHGVLPSGFCDNDVKKQGKHLKSMPELTIFSFADALKDERSEFLVVSGFHSNAIMGALVFEKQVSEKRILNYQPLEKRKACFLMAQYAIVEDSDFVCCCDMERRPTLVHSGNPQADIASLEETRKRLICGEMPMPDGCQSCRRNQVSYIYSSLKLNIFDFSFCGWCNYKCKYCSANQPDRKNYNDQFYLEQYLIELEKRDMVNDIFSVLFAVGEPTLNEKRFGLYEHCREKQYFLDVFSNCSVFDESLFGLAQESPVIIRKSFDAGTPETYAKIKGVDCYRKMLENVKRYQEAPFLALNPKYLFVPGVNDGERDIYNFVEMCAEIKVDFVTPVFSFLDDQYANSRQAQSNFRLLVDELAANGIFTANVDTVYSESYHNLYEKSFTQQRMQ